MNSRGRVLLSFLPLLGLLVSFTALAIAPPLPSPVVDTNKGKVRGVIEKNVSAYKGIRYGAPMIGSKRFMAAEPAAPWKGIADAIDYGAPAIQMYTRPLVATDLSLQIGTVYTTGSDQKIDNEDCLFLNVWTPQSATEKRPVMVWFHGGGYAYGSGHWPVYDGTNLAAKGDVVVVTVNHRLNVFGYLNLAKYDEKLYAESGNAGILDLVLALEWVRDNIAAFGGDPENVTIMGESGGGAKVSTLMAMPKAQGLFHKAIIQSGPGLRGVSSETAANTAQMVLNELDITPDNLDKLAILSSDEILNAAIAAEAKAGPRGRAAFRLAPVVDGKVLPQNPFLPTAPEQSRDIPVMIGWNKDEMSIFNAGAPWFGTLTNDQLVVRSKSIVGEKATPLIEAYRELYPDYNPTYLFNMLLGDSRMFIGSITLAERKIAQQAAPVFMYQLVWDTPVGGGVFKSPHTLDMPFMFNNVDKSVAITGDSKAARSLENQMSSAWIAFAHKGDPNNDQLPSWPKYNTSERATMHFDAKPVVVNDPKQKVRLILQQR